ncbi:MAG TPA: glutathione S-transferase family protein [Kiloniellales bacterium]|nr:glutathione S-transferase family protein [Kiloniellales bacterium]
MKLFYAPQSPFARKVRAAAIEVGLDKDIELMPAAVAPGRENQVYAAKINPLRKIPALALDSGEVLVDSSVICEYLDAKAGGGKLLPKDGEARWRVLTQHAIAQGMTDAMILVRYETSLRPEPQRWPVWVEDQWDKFWTGLAWFETRARDVLPMPPRQLDVAQLALAAVLGYVDFRFPQSGWQRRAPQVARWFSQASALPALRETVPYDPPPA